MMVLPVCLASRRTIMRSVDNRGKTRVTRPISDDRFENFSLKKPYSAERGDPLPHCLGQLQRSQSERRQQFLVGPGVNESRFALRRQRIDRDDLIHPPATLPPLVQDLEKALPDVPIILF